MDQDYLARKLLETFHEELQEHLRIFNESFLSIERTNDPEFLKTILQTVFRSAHSLKGAAHVVNATMIEKACHHLEDIFAAMRDQEAVVPSEKFSILFETIDGLDEASRLLGSDDDPDQSRLGMLLPELRDLSAFILEDAAIKSGKRTTRTAKQSPVKSVSAKDTDARVDERADDGEKPESRELKESEKSEESKASTDLTVAQEPIALKPAAVASQKLDASHEKTKPRLVEDRASLRVAAKKLDALMARSSELLVARRCVETHHEELASIRELMHAWKSNWRTLESSVNRLRAGGGQIPSSDATVGDNLADAMFRFQSGIKELERRIDLLAGSLVDDTRFLARTCEALDDEIHRVRMLPFREACNGLARAARDIARSNGKKVSVQIEGGDVEVDRSVLEEVKDPLLHLIRNAIDHGIELPDDRLKQGKSDYATITISAELRGSQVEVKVGDDGRGFDLKRIKERAIAMGMSVSDDPHEISRLVFQPGFSTNESVSGISGRGVGLDVVREKIESLHGEVILDFEPGVGTTFSLVTPLTLTSLRAMLIEAGAQTYAIPTANVVRSIRFDAKKIRRIAGRNILVSEGESLLLVDVASMLNCDSRLKMSDTLTGVVVESGKWRVLLVVSNVTSEQEVVIRKFGSRIKRLAYFSGAMLLPSGEIGLVLNMASFIHGSMKAEEPFGEHD